MNRRQFFRCGCAALALPFVPQVADAAPVDLGLKIRRIYDPEAFVPNKVEFSKGPHKTIMTCGSGQDLRDCHGLCATHEMVYITVDYLEYSQESLTQIWTMPKHIEYFSPEAEARSKKLKKELRRCVVTKEERLKIFAFWHIDRGPHDCVYPALRLPARRS